MKDAKQLLTSYTSLVNLDRAHLAMLAPNLATLLVVAVATTPLARAATPAPPSQLFATDSYTKILVTANSQDPPTTYPEYTAADGSWSLFPSSDWTSAFFPSLLYRLHERHTVLCPSTTPTADNGSTTDWLSLARSWGEGLYAPDASQLSEWTHDVGFLSWPAQTELEMNSGNTTVGPVSNSSDRRDIHLITSCATGSLNRARRGRSSRSALLFRCRMYKKLGPRRRQL